MSLGGDEWPVHDSLTVVDSEEIYRTTDWWKAVVRYQYEGSDNSEVAVYMWHRDEGWTRKNKYVVKTGEAWETDDTVIRSLFNEDEPSVTAEEFPVSDYYSLSAGKTIFKTDEWWKAILKISQKGDYETSEVMVYLWQRQDEKWRRRQKYTAKSLDKWDEESAAIEKVLNRADSGQQAETSANEEPTPESTGSGTSLSAGNNGSRSSLSTVDSDALDSSVESHLSDRLE